MFSPEDGVPRAGGFFSGMGAPGLMEAAPDGRLWLTPEGDWQRANTDCDGVTSFDGQTWTGFLSGECIYGLDAAEDGTLWLLAGRPERDGDRPGDSHTYVITPEAVAATEWCRVAGRAPFARGRRSSDDLKATG